MDEHVENKQAVSEPGALAPVASEAAAESSAPKAEQAAELSALEARLESRIQDEVEKRFQSAKDKRWAQLEKQYGELRELAKANGQAEEEAEASSGTTPLARARRLLTMAGLNDDPEAMRLLKDYLGGSNGHETHLLTEVAELALRRLKREPVAAGAVIQPGGGRAAPDLRADYERAVKRLRPGDVAGLSELKREFRKKGLEVF